MLKKPQSQYTLEVSVPSRGVRYLNGGYLHPWTLRIKFSSPLGE